MIIATICGVCFALVGYGFTSYRTHQKNEFDRSVPSFSQILDGAKRSLKPSKRLGGRPLVQDFKASTWRLVKGVAWAAIIALFIGILAATSSTADAFISWPLIFLASIPPTALLGVVMAVIGEIDETYYTVMVALGIVMSLSLSVRNQGRQIAKALIDQAYTLGSSHLQVITRVVFPQIVPRFLQSVQTSLGVAFIMLIAAEFSFGEVGIGIRIRTLSKKLDPMIYFYMGMLGLLALAMVLLLSYTRRVVAPWFDAKGDR